MRLPEIAPIAVPLDAMPWRRARIGRPSRRSIRAPSAFIVRSSNPAKKLKTRSDEEGGR